MSVYRNMIPLLAGVLLTVLSACAPMQPNPDTVQNGEGPAPETSVSSDTARPQEEADSSQTLSTAAPQEESLGLQTEYRGGIVNYQVESVSIEDSYEAAGVDVTQVVGQQELGEGEKFLTITFSLENESLDPATLEGDYLVNNFYLVTQETVDARQEGAVFNSPIYFDQAVEDEKRYFALELPAVGEGTEITLGWALSTTDLQALENSQLNLVYTTMGWDEATILGGADRKLDQIKPNPTDCGIPKDLARKVTV